MNDPIFNSDKGTLTIKRSFNASVQLVWRAWTEPDLIDKWWAPEPWKSQTKRMEFREGGVRIYVMIGPEGEEHWGRTDFESIKPFQEFGGKDSFCDKEGVVNPDFPIGKFTYTFIERGENTDMIMITAYESEEALRKLIDLGMVEGWRMVFDKLDSILKGMTTSQH